MEIATDRLLLREFVDDDVRALAAYQADPRYAEFWPEAVTPRESRQLLDTFLGWAEERPRRNYQLAIALATAPAALIGTCGLRGHGRGVTTAEFGLELAPESWGHGYATEAATAILAFGFHDLGLTDVRGLSVTENVRVTTLVSRLGFTRVGRSEGPAWMTARGWTQTEWQLTSRER